jgi:hypothetical protein
MVSAYKVEVYRLGAIPDPKNFKIHSSTKKRKGNKFKKPGVLLDGNLTGNMWSPDPGANSKYVIINLRTIAEVKDVAFFSSSDYQNWRRIGITVMRSVKEKYAKMYLFYNPSEEYDAVICHLENDDGEGPVGQYVKIELLDNWAINYDDKNANHFTLSEILINAVRYEELIQGVVSLQDSVKLVFAYQDEDNDNVPEIYMTDTELTGHSDSSLGLFRLDNNAWIYVSGMVDVQKNIIALNTQTLGTYAIFPMNKAKIKDTGPFQFSKRYLTPDGDGVNDCLEINVTPPGPVKLDICIYNIFGKRVKRVVKNVAISGPYSATWCGKDDYDVDLEVGTYLFEIRFNGKKEINGLILLVK